MPTKKAMSKKSASKGMISEYGGMEKYPSKASMKSHEKMESKKIESGEKKAYKLMMSKKKK